MPIPVVVPAAIAILLGMHGGKTKREAEERIKAEEEDRKRQ
jgi:hypothetical protein